MQRKLKAEDVDVAVSHATQLSSGSADRWYIGKYYVNLLRLILILEELPKSSTENKKKKINSEANTRNKKKNLDYWGNTFASI